MRSKHFVSNGHEDPIYVEFSQEASLILDDGAIIGAFQHNTFLARVTRPDRVNVVAFPPGSGAPSHKSPQDAVNATEGVEDGVAVVLRG
jgi:hypothetical protein